MGSKRKSVQKKLMGLAGALPAMNIDKKEAMRAAGETLTDAFLGAILGGAAGAVFGKFSFLLGAVVNGYGNYHDNQYVRTFGLGMMASNGFQSKNSLGGTENEPDGLDGVKDRVINFGTSMSEKFFIDKFVKKYAEKLQSPTPASGLGEIQYIASSDDAKAFGELGAGEVDFSALDRIQKQIENSGKRYGGQVNGDIAGLLSSVEGAEDEQISGDMGAIDLDPTTQNY